jgi:hypothetical protein
MIVPPDFAPIMPFLRVARDGAICGAKPKIRVEEPFGEGNHGSPSGRLGVYQCDRVAGAAGGDMSLDENILSKDEYRRRSRASAIFAK